MWTSKKSDDRGHAQEVHHPGRLKTAEQGGELGELHRLPQREAGDHDEDADRHDAEIENFLNGVVVRQIVVAETEAQRVARQSP